MLGCRASCPNCKHEFTCCSGETSQQCCAVRRTLSGGGLIATYEPPSLVGSSIVPTFDVPLKTPQLLNLRTTPCVSPQVSPSVPLTFVMPPMDAPLLLSQPPMAYKPETELQRLQETVWELRQCGFYYEGLTYLQANELLKDCDVGTFLVRNSSDPKYLFSLSVQTAKGPTAVRLFYVNGYFRLDALKHLHAAMPMFPSVVSLIRYYRDMRKKYINGQAWVDHHGQWYSSILIVKPLIKKGQPLSLKHLARLAVHKALESSIQLRVNMLPAPHTKLELPRSLTNYLGEYPHSL